MADLKSQVMGLFAAFPASPVPPEAWAARVVAYVEDLSEYAPDVAVEAIRLARRNAQAFCPSIKDIRDIADRLRADRVPKIAWAPEPAPVPPPGGYCTPEQAAEVMERLGKVRRVPSAGVISQTEFERRQAASLAAFDEYMRKQGHDWPPTNEQLQAQRPTGRNHPDPTLSG